MIYILALHKTLRQVLDAHQVELVFLIGTFRNERVGALDCTFDFDTIVEPCLDNAAFDRLVNVFSVFSRLVH